jgi:hypothetical protein
MSDYFLNKIYDSLLFRKPVPKKPEPIVEKKKAFKPLKDVYYRIIAERIEEAKDHIAVYGSQELVDPKDIPQKPGLDVLGVASKVDTERLRQRLRVETETFKVSIKDLLVKKGLPVKQLLTQLTERIINSDLPYPDEFFNFILKNNGLFKIPQTGTFNCINPIVNNFVSQFADAKKDSDKLYNFLTNMLQDPLKMDSSMNIGPGEVYLCLFANAEMAVGETGSKSGDIVADGVALEVKATTFKTDETEEGKKQKRAGKGARLGGTDNNASKGLQTVPQYIQSVNKEYNADMSASKKADKKLVSEINNEIENIKPKLQSSQSSEEMIQLFDSFYNNLRNIAHRNRMASHVILRRMFDPFTKVWNQPNKQLPKNLLQPVKSSGRDIFKTEIGARSQTRPFIDTYKDFINSSIKEEISSFKDTQQIQPIKKDTARLDELLIWALEAVKDLPNITLDNIVDNIILPLNSYPTTYFDISNEIKTTLGSRENTISKYTSLTEAGELIGAIHLYSYTLATKFDSLLIINAQKGDSIIFSAPKNLQDALTITQTPGVIINTAIDRPGGKTMGRAQSVNIQYKV